MSIEKTKNAKKEPVKSLPAQLMEQHDELDFTITENLLKKDRVGEPNEILEGQLESVRVEDKGGSLEYRLNKTKGKFDIKHRNDKTSSGQINKIEEQRLKTKKAEDEKFEPASEVNKHKRWWENIPKPKKASSFSSFISKYAKEVFDPAYVSEGEGFNSAPTDDDYDNPDDKLKLPANDFSEKSNSTDVLDEPSIDEAVSLVKSTDVPMAGPGFNKVIQLLVSPKAIKKQNKEVGDAVVDFVNSNKLAKIDLVDFHQNSSSNGNMVTLTLFGDKFSPQKMEAPVGEEEDITEHSFEIDNSTGTPIAIGALLISDNLLEEEDEEIVQQIVDFLNVKHEDDGLVAVPDAIDLNRNEGVASYALAINPAVEDESQLANPEQFVKNKADEERMLEDAKKDVIDQKDAFFDSKFLGENEEQDSDAEDFSIEQGQGAKIAGNWVEIRTSEKKKVTR